MRIRNGAREREGGARNKRAKYRTEKTQTHTQTRLEIKKREREVNEIGLGR